MLIGVSLRDYNDMTPRELDLHVEVYIERMKKENEDRMAAAWLSAYYQRVKKMPDLNKVLKQAKAEKKAKQTDQEMFANMKAALAAMQKKGG